MCLFGSTQTEKTGAILPRSVVYRTNPPSCETSISAPRPARTASVRSAPMGETPISPDPCPNSANRSIRVARRLGGWNLIDSTIVVLIAMVLLGGYVAFADLILMNVMDLLIQGFKANGS